MLPIGRWTLTCALLQQCTRTVAVKYVEFELSNGRLPVQFGNGQVLLLGVDFLEPEPFLVFDQFMCTDYGDCQRFCGNPCAASGGFCRAFCSPLCCEGSASTRCYQSHRNEAYRHDSPFFHRLTNTSDYGAWSRAGRNGNRVVGIHALDRLSLLSAISQDPVPSWTSLPLGLVQLAALVWPDPPHTAFSGTLGLAPRPDSRTLPQMLHRRGVIDSAMVSLHTYRSRLNHRLIHSMALGPVWSPHCHPPDWHASAHPAAWLLEADSFHFLSLRHTGTSRLLLQYDQPLHVADRLLDRLLADGTLHRPHHQFALANCTVASMREAGLRWTLNTRHYSIRPIDFFLEYEGGASACECPIRRISESPDQLDFVLGRPFVARHCVSLDFDAHRVGLSLRKPEFE